jgi:hypothetical protein
MSEEKRDRRYRPAEKKKSVRIEIMVSPAEQDEMIRAAESRNMSLSEHVRDYIKRGHAVDFPSGVPGGIAMEKKGKK